MIKKFVRFLVAPFLLLCLITGWSFIRLLEFVYDDSIKPKMSDEILDDSKEILPWLIFRE